MSYSSKKYGINVEFHPSFAGDKDAAMRALDKTLDYIGSGDPSSKQALVTFLKNIKKMETQYILRMEIVILMSKLLQMETWVL